MVNVVIIFVVCLCEAHSGYTIRQRLRPSRKTTTFRDFFDQGICELFCDTMCVEHRTVNDPSILKCAQTQHF